MTLWTLVRRSLRHHARSHLGTFLGATVGTAVLVGALVVGDSVRGSLRTMAAQRLGSIQLALGGSDRFFEDSLATRLAAHARRSVHSFGGLPGTHDRLAGVLAAIQLPATATREDGAAHASRVTVYGLPDGRLAFEAPTSNGPATAPFAPTAPVPLPAGSVLLNEALAAQLRVQAGDIIVLRVAKPGILSRDTAISPRDEASAALRLTVHRVLPAVEGGNLSLKAGGAAPWNAFVRRDELAGRLELKGRANLLLAGDVVRDGPASLGDTSAWGRLASLWRKNVVQHSLPDEEALGLVSSALDRCWDLGDAELELRPTPDRQAIELVSRRIFLDPAVVSAATEPRTEWLTRDLDEAARFPEADEALAKASWVTNHSGVLTYLATLLRSGERSAPYSMVAAAGPPWTPSDLQPGEVVVNEWLAEDLRLHPGSDLELRYFVVESGSRLLERRRSFRVRQVVPLAGVHADRTLMPEFPGIAQAEKTSDWDGGFPLEYPVRPEDEEYWKQHRGTPKAFLSLAEGQQLWTNRFGNLTALRFPVPPGGSLEEHTEVLRRNLLANLDPQRAGLTWQPVRAQARRGVDQAQDFGGLFLGFSFFLIVAALLLMALLFLFAIERRTAEVGTLLSLGFTPRQLRRLLWHEGAALALLGSLAGTVGGLAYARALIHGLSTLWRDAVSTTTLEAHAEPVTLFTGALAGTIVCWLTMGLTLRRQAARPARELLGDGSGEVGAVPETKSRAPDARWIAALCGVTALALVAVAVARQDNASAGTFFGAGALWLVASIAAAAAWLRRLARRTASAPRSLLDLGVRNLTRRRGRSLATLGLLACGSFLIGSIGVFRLDAVRHATQRSSGTGGFALIGQSALPVLHDLNSESGRDALALRAADLVDVDVVPLRVRDGDDASCLNLNRAQQPRLLGVRPELLAERHAFSFARVARGLPREDPWRLLAPASSGTTPSDAEAVPAIGDLSSILWAMGKRVGDTLTYTDERGQPFRVRIVAAVANSILQGSLVIDEAAFVRRFPSESGHRMFLVDALPERSPEVAAVLTRALRDVGFEVTPAVRLLESFNAVQNTYLGTFQVLGGLGLLLGSLGLGVLLLRNVLERRGELAILLAVGYRRHTLRHLLVWEHGTLLLGGLGAGVVSAAIAVLPSVLSPTAEVPYGSLSLTLGAVLLCGILWTLVAAAVALRGELLNALRQE